VVKDVPQPPDVDCFNFSDKFGDSLAIAVAPGDKSFPPVENFAEEFLDASK
jgi:hypothetical protein